MWVPHGSGFGPLLFLINITDLPYILQHSECILFADINKHFGAINEITELKKDLKIKSDWMKNNKFVSNKRKHRKRILMIKKTLREN